LSALLIDEMNLYEELGQELFETLSRTFYSKVYADTEEWFRGMFAVDIETAIQNQWEFLVQRFGGPPLYSERKGHPALRARHRAFAITDRAAKRWLRYMVEAVEEVEMPRAAREAMIEFFLMTANFLRNSDD